MTGRLHQAFSCLLLVSILGACAKPDVIVLLPEEDGTVGNLSVSNSSEPDRSVTLSEPLKAARIGGAFDRDPRTSTFTPDQVDELFGDALGILPAAETAFTFKFASGAIQPDEDASALIDEIVDQASARGFAEIDIVGHADTVGAASDNLELSKQRVATINTLIDARLQDPLMVVVKARALGETDLPVPTSDDTDNSENRRVVVTVR